MTLYIVPGWRSLAKPVEGWRDENVAGGLERTLKGMDAKNPRVGLEHICRLVLLGLINASVSSLNNRKIISTHSLVKKINLNLEGFTGFDPNESESLLGSWGH